jgi:hypothetical protein
LFETNAPIFSRSLIIQGHKRKKDRLRFLFVINISSFTTDYRHGHFWSSTITTRTAHHKPERRRLD